MSYCECFWILIFIWLHVCFMAVFYRSNLVHTSPIFNATVIGCQTPNAKWFGYTVVPKLKLH